MKYEIPGTDLLVDRKKQLFNKDGSTCSLPIIDNNITLTMYGKERTFDLTWLTLISLFDIRDETLWPYIKFVRMPNIPKGIKYRLVCTKILYYNDDPNYRIHLEFPNIAITKDGICINVTTGKTISPYLPPADNFKNYPTVHTYRPLQRKTDTVVIHRLVALSWVQNNDWANKFIVNHLDGNKLNWHASNLEWCDYTRNNIHAVETGLNTQAIKVRARHHKTGELLEFASIANFSEAMNVDIRTVACWAIKANTLYNGYEVRLGDDKTPWVYEETENIQVMNVEAGRYIVDVDEGTGTIKRFNGTRAMIPHYKLWNMGSTGIKAILKTMREKYPAFNVVVTDQYDTREIEVLDVKTGKVEVYHTTTSLAKDLNTAVGNIVSAIYTNGKRVVCGKRMRRKSNSSWPDITKLKSSSVTLKVTWKDTGVTEEYTSLRETARSLKVDRDKLKRCIRKPIDTDPYSIVIIK